MDTQTKPAMDAETGVVPTTHHARQGQKDLTKPMMEEFKKQRQKYRLLKVTKSQHSIFRVPANLREDPKAYEPKVVAIGPYHRRNDRLLPMEAVKWETVSRLLSAPDPHDDVVERCFEKLEAEERRARQCYQEPMTMSADEFTQMMFLDGCFIVQILLLEEAKRLEYHSKCEVGLGVTAPEELINQLRQVQSDLLLLENQIPFFIIQLIVENIMPRTNLGPLIRTLFYKLQPHKNIKSYAPAPYGNNLLHLFHRSLVPQDLTGSLLRPPPPAQLRQSHSKLRAPVPVVPPPQIPQIFVSFPPAVVREESDAEEAPPPEVTWFPNASELEEAGVVIKKKEEGKMLDVKFHPSRGVLQIPPLSVNAHSKTLFQNLMALEQCQPGVKARVTAYSAFLGCLIRTERDVTILQRKDIIVSCLSNAQQTAALFNTLWRQTWHTQAAMELQDLFRSLGEYCKRRRPRWRAVLVRDYFGNPWAIISVIAAGVLLTVAIAQTIFTVFPYYRPSRQD